MQKGFINNLASCSRRRAAVYSVAIGGGGCGARAGIRGGSASDSELTRAATTNGPRERNSHGAMKNRKPNAPLTVLTWIQRVQITLVCNCSQFAAQTSPTCNAQSKNSSLPCTEKTVTVYSVGGLALRSLRCRETTQSINTASAFGCPCCCCWLLELSVHPRTVEIRAAWPALPMYLKFGG